MPLLLIFAGVIGGLISLGFMGVFVGPVILAVAFVLVQDWISEQPETEKKTTPEFRKPAWRTEVEEGRIKLRRQALESRLDHQQT